ncbi:unnamed protein product [Cladocopium goreaui]|uniref:Polyadenylate-binding protein 4 (PABP-4) (Poly(A)-binding protein 4) (Activated-platelet protein 1) (APP-1) (Inducible poly(A)-binding protein) (IPABP) n=1 Tax=Cladocopium goreaui TaxID=2562237 RepID=A0A9P1C9T5_9DINO|nr:unnamed protein product [Cladocopium goreaui]
MSLRCCQDTKEEDLRKQFKGFGKITDVSVKTFETGEGRGYAFITFKKLEEARKFVGYRPLVVVAQKAIEADGDRWNRDMQLEKQRIQGMHEKPQPEGKPLLVTMAVHQPGEGKGKGKDGGWGAAEVGDGGMTCNMVFIRALIPKTKYS